MTDEAFGYDLSQECESCDAEPPHASCHECSTYWQVVRDSNEQREVDYRAAAYEALAWLGSPK